jgi:hypothetical protein
MAAVTAGVIAAGATVASAAYSMSGKGGPDAPDAPDAPKFNEAYRNANRAQINNMPRMIDAELAARARFNDQELDQRLDFMGRSAREVARQSIDISKEMAPEYIAQNQAMLEQYDPKAMALRNEIGQQLLAELQLGRERSSVETNRDISSIRAAQAARGNSLGDASVLQESKVLREGDEKAYQQRLANASAFLNLPTPSDMLRGVNPGYNPLSPQGQFQFINPNLGAQAAGVAAQNFGTQAGIYQTQLDQPNPWMQGLGMVAGAAGRFSGAMANMPQKPPAIPGATGLPPGHYG